MDIGKLHVVILHFPIALILAAAAADALWLWRKKPIFKEAGYYCILLGAAAAIPTMIAGLMYMDMLEQAHDISDAAIGELHESLGIMTATAAVLAAALRVVLRNNLSGMFGWVYGLLIATAAVLVTLAGHYGGLLAFGKDYLSNLF